MSILKKPDLKTWNSTQRNYYLSPLSIVLTKCALDSYLREAIKLNGRAGLNTWDLFALAPEDSTVLRTMKHVLYGA